MNAIAVGGIERRRIARAGARTPPRRTARAASPRWDDWQAQEHAGTVVWLASDYAGYITGQVIDANGGARR